MADQWEEAAKQFKPDPNAPKPSASTGNDDWKVWQQGGGATPASAPIGEQPLSPGGLARTMLETGKGAAKELGSTAYNLATGPAAGPIGMAAGYAGRKLGITPKVEAVTEPSNTSQQIGKYGAMAGEMLAPMPKALKLLPSTERAGESLQRVNAAVGKVPVDLTKASEPVFGALQLERTGSGAPPAVISKLSERLPQHGGAPVPFEESRLFQSNAGRLSTAEQMAAKPQMQRQVSLLAKALAEENERVATEGGVGPLYKSALTEYRHAKQLEGLKEGAVDLAKKTATRYVLGGVGLGAGYYGARKLFGE